ncbi:TPA: hypothetical protein HNJ19_02105 [Escherichia coli]|nr:hypothetical protein [Escherichia coli]OYA02104.1 starvation-sensing protein RspA [Escherichia coli]TGH89927.1 hypothetical protein E5S36_00390 [Escherichia coli]HAJ6973495.1 hypothetical protein [Escherichia coli]HAJ6985539.1 hypothetical protein [Escherichia coli]
MKIVKAEVFVTCPGRNFVTLKITTEDGITGLGDATLNGRELSVASYLQDHLCPQLIGRDAHRIEDIWQFFYKGAYWRRGPVTGFYNVLREVVKHYRRGESVIKEEWVKELCQHCHGKGEASTACRGCKGKGIVLDEKRTRFHGVPVYKICGRCNGNRFSRLPTTLARRHVQKLVPDLTDYQWYKGYADVIGKLVTKCWQEEAYAEAQLRKVTR